MITLRDVKAPEETEELAYDRAQHQCQFPNCLQTRNLELHHIDGNRSNDDLKYNLIVLCARHRREARLYRNQQLITWANKIRFAYRQNTLTK